MSRPKLPVDEKKVSINTTVSQENFNNSKAFKSQADYYEFLLQNLSENGKKELEEKVRKFVFS